MKRIQFSMLFVILLLTAGATTVFAVDYTFTGTVVCKEGAPIEGAVARVLYFYTFEGGPTRSGSVYVTTGANGNFSVVRDISGPSPVEYVEAWAWVGGLEKYLTDCQPTPDNYIGHWKFLCSGPEVWLDYYVDP